MIVGGRGIGKTITAVHYVLDHLRTHKDKARVGVGAPTLEDARGTCAEGETGLITVGGLVEHGGEFTAFNRSTLEAWHKDGGYVKFLGSLDPGRWNGPQWSLLWWDELALCNRAAWQQSQFGLRLGPHPRNVVTTTPKQAMWVKELFEAPGTFHHPIVSTYDNPHLPARRLAAFEREYGGTDLGRRELLGQWLAEAEGAAWRREWIDAARVAPEQVPAFVRVVIGVDPAGSHKPKACETGICVAARGVDQHLYVLDARGVRLPPADWARLVQILGELYGADCVVAERNYGGDFVASTIQTAWPEAHVVQVVATRGKLRRAEPIAARYQQGYVHHVGAFTELEDQMTLYVPGADADAVDLLDRMDALVWALWELTRGWTPPARPSAPVEHGGRQLGARPSPLTPGGAPAALPDALKEQLARVGAGTPLRDTPRMVIGRAWSRW
jgi:phage terminase large subunit-like protein